MKKTTYVIQKSDIRWQGLENWEKSHDSKPIKVPNIGDQFNVIIKNDIFSTSEWCDIRVKKKDSVEPLTQFGTFQIFNGRIEIEFKSISPREWIQETGYDGFDSYYFYKQVSNPQGLELIIYT